MCSHAFWGMHAWALEAICKSACVGKPFCVCKGIYHICVYFIRNLDCDWCCGDRPVGKEGIVLKGSDWPFFWTSRLW